MTWLMEACIWLTAGLVGAFAWIGVLCYFR